MGSSSALAPAKNLVVYRNGDPFFGGAKVVLSERRCPTWEALLGEVTRRVGAAVAVRALYTARRGRRVARLAQLRHGGQYVAAGTEPFKRLDYLNCGVKQRSERRNSPGLQRRAAAPCTAKVPAPRQEPVRPLRVIHVFRNGDLLSPPFRLLLSGSALLEQDTLLTLLTEKVNVRSGAVRKLCRLDGTQVCKAEQLVNGGYYVAVGAEKYQNLPYLELLVAQAPVCGTRRNHPNSRRRNDYARVGKLCSTSQDRASNSALAFPPHQLDNRREKTTEAPEKDKIPLASPPQKPPRKPQLQEEESLFYARPVRVGQNRKNNMNVQHWPDQGAVYEAKDARRETRGAQEVKEDEHTKVEVPIDQTVADTVEEEIIQKAKMRSHKVWSTDKAPRSMELRKALQGEKHGKVSSLAARNCEDLPRERDGTGTFG